MTAPTAFRGIYRDDLAARAVYSESAGIARVLPRAVAVPRDPDDVCALVAWAAATGTPLVPRGSGSSMAGGAVGDGLLIDMSGFKSIATIDDARRLWVGAGVTCNTIDREARTHGLRFPVDPSSAAFCTIGGMVSTNAAGARTLKYGATRRWVTALDCVFDDGSRAIVRRGSDAPANIAAVSRFARDVAPDLRTHGATGSHAGVRKDSSGYAIRDYSQSGDLVDLLVGSEGTLALVVGVEVALAPVPLATASVLAAFRSLDDAVVGAARAREAGASACELIDRTFLDVAREGGAVPVMDDAESVLMIELEGDDPTAVGNAARALASDLRAAGAVEVTLGLSPDDEAALWKLRHAASPILAALDPSLASMQFVEDGAVPPDRLADYVRGVRGVMAAHGTRGVLFGHAGDAHVHANALVDTSRDGWRGRVEGILADVAALTVRLGGTLAGEHGDGRLRAPLVAESWGPAAAALFARVKRSFDPAGILNPGVKVPLAGQRPIGDVKYDPMLPPLPERARRVLDRVLRDRAYARSRLEMLADED